MTRRLQLLDPESRSSGRRVTVVFGRIRDGLLRDNKVVPAVLGILALLTFAWLIAGALIDGLGREEQQASNQASLAQGEDSDSGDSETPAPEADNRDSDASYGGYDEGPKDPFRDILNKAGEGTSGGQNGSQGSSRAGSSRAGSQNDRNGGDRNVGSANGGTGKNGQGSNRGRTGAAGGGGGYSESFIEQSSPGNQGFHGAPGGGGGQDGASQGGADRAGVGQGGGLFNSGGDLPIP
jgi:hypothetical protein